MVDLEELPQQPWNATSSSANWGKTDDDMDRLEAASAANSRPECVPEDAHFVPVTR